MKQKNKIYDLQDYAKSWDAVMELAVDVPYVFYSLWI